MANRTRKKIYTIEEFEAMAQELLHIALTMSEERIHAVPRLESPIGKAMAEATMNVKYALRTFIALERLHGK